MSFLCFVDKVHWEKRVCSLPLHLPPQLPSSICCVGASGRGCWWWESTGYTTRYYKTKTMVYIHKQGRHVVITISCVYQVSTSSTCPMRMTCGLWILLSIQQPHKFRWTRWRRSSPSFASSTGSCSSSNILRCLTVSFVRLNGTIMLVSFIAFIEMLWSSLGL